VLAGEMARPVGRVEHEGPHLRSLLDDLGDVTELP